MTESVQALLDQLIKTRDELTRDMLSITACLAHPSHVALSQVEQEMLAQQLQVMTAYQLILASRIKFYQSKDKA